MQSVFKPTLLVHTSVTSSTGNYQPTISDTPRELMQGNIRSSLYCVVLVPLLVEQTDGERRHCSQDYACSPAEDFH